MDKQLYALVGILIGSVGAVLIGKVFDLFTSRRQHKHRLQQEYFYRKLQVFEKATEQNVLIISALANLSLMLKNVTKEELYFSADTIESINQHVTTMLGKLTESALSGGNSVFLYSEPKGGKIADLELMNEFMGALGELGKVNFEAEELERIRQQIADKPELEQKLAPVIEQKSIELDKKLKDLGKSCDKLVDDFEKQILRYRTEVKRLDIYKEKKPIK